MLQKRSQKIDIFFYIFMIIVYLAPFIAGHFITGHMMFFRYMVLKQYWFDAWKGIHFVQGALVILLGIAITLLFIQTKKYKRMLLNNILNVVTILLALYVSVMDPFTTLVYFFIFVTVHVNVGLSFLLIAFSSYKKST